MNPDQNAAVSPQSLIQQLSWRYATKKFDPTKKIPSASWQALEQALVLSPSSFGLQPWKFIVVTHLEVRKKLVAVSWSQTQPADCSHFVVLAVRTQLSVEDIDHYVARISEVRNIPVEKLAAYREMMVGSQKQMAEKGLLSAWATRQVYIALGNLLTSAAILGLDACPMEGFEPPGYDKILELEGTGYSAVVACALGYRAASDQYIQMPKVRFPTEEMIRHIA
jgi:nitroreductase